MSAMVAFEGELNSIVKEVGIMCKSNVLFIVHVVVGSFYLFHIVHFIVGGVCTC